MAFLSKSKHAKMEEDKIDNISTTIYKVITNQSKSPDSNLIEKLKKLKEDSFLNFSIDDYDLICRNKMVKKIMVKTLNTDVNKLNAICKKIKIFKKYIDLSPKKIKEKMKAKKSPIKDLAPELLSYSTAIDDTALANNKISSILDLPDHVIEHITHHSLKNIYMNNMYKLKNGIPEDKLDLKYLSANPNALNFLTLPENIEKINYSQLSKNTNLKAIELLNIKINANPNNTDIDWRYLSKNSEAFVILNAHQTKIDYKWLSSNTDPGAIDLLKKQIQINPNNIDWSALSKNPDAIELLKANRDKIDFNQLAANQSAEAIELLLEEIRINQEKLSWFNLSTNPIPIAIKLLEANQTEIVWGKLTSNTNSKAIKLLKDNPTKITWSSLSSNPSAIALLEERIKYENNLPEDVYKALKVFEKINWKNISSNPRAIELLKKRIIYENNLHEDVYKALKMHEKISWEKLSENPSIFSRIY